MNPKLKDSITEAQSLLAYAARSGITIDIGMVGTITATASKFASANGSISDQEETAFWMAFDALAKTLAPVNVSSIMATMDSNTSSGRHLFGIPVVRWSPARWAVFQYTMLAYAALVILIPIQIYWLVGVVITSDIQATETTYTQLQSSVDKSDQKEQQMTHQQFQIESGYKLLEIWSSFWEKSVEELAPACKNVDAEHSSVCMKTSREKSASVVLRILQQYFLPMLYGLLGATVYILRTLANQIRCRCYSNSCDIDFRIRLFLGTLGGLVSAWFLTPDVANGIFKSLSPFAIAFLTGYSVELMFAAMDRIISMVTQPANK
jgi:hypothetical protein